MSHKTRRYMIEMRDVATGQSVIMSAVDLTDKDRNVVASRIAGLAGVPASVADFLADMVPPDTQAKAKVRHRGLKLPALLRDLADDVPKTKR